MEYVGGGVDYISGPYTVLFNPGETTLSFNIPISNDNIQENDETFQLRINAFTLPNNVTVGDQGFFSTVTILANDRK